MQFKLVPPAPDTVAFVADAQRAVPLVPGTEDDCCARLMRRLDLPSRDVARTWLTFLRALELVAERESGFVRRSREPTRDHLTESFLDRVYGARALYESLGAEPRTTETAFERFEDLIPEWERHKDPTGWRDTWQERVGHLLDWLVLLDLADCRPDGYVRAEDERTNGGGGCRGS